MKRLIGRTIKEIKLGENKNNQRDSITFCTDEGNLLYEAFGDCCSTSYIHEICNKEDLIGHKVTKVVEHENPEQFNDKDGCTLIQVYNYDIVTEEGTCTIDFRNESNGYYGGYLEFKESE